MQSSFVELWREGRKYFAHARGVGEAESCVEAPEDVSKRRGFSLK